MGALMRRHCTKTKRQRVNKRRISWGKGFLLLLLLFYWRMNVGKLELNCWNDAHKCVLYGLIRNYNFTDLFFLRVYLVCVVCACFAAHNQYNNTFYRFLVSISIIAWAQFSVFQRKRDRGNEKQNEVKSKWCTKKEKKRNDSRKNHNNNTESSKSLFLKSIVRILHMSIYIYIYASKDAVINNLQLVS